MLTRHLHCPIAPGAAHGAMAGSNYHCPPIPRRERSPGAGIWLQSAEYRPNRARTSLDRHATYIVAAYVAGACAARILDRQVDLSLLAACLAL